MATPHVAADVVLVVLEALDSEAEAVVAAVPLAELLESETLGRPLDRLPGLLSDTLVVKVDGIPLDPGTGTLLGGSMPEERVFGGLLPVLVEEVVDEMVTVLY